VPFYPIWKFRKSLVMSADKKVVLEFTVIDLRNGGNNHGNRLHKSKIQVRVSWRTKISKMYEAVKRFIRNKHNNVDVEKIRLVVYVHSTHTHT
jgi:hypothetical protein